MQKRRQLNRIFSLLLTVLLLVTLMPSSIYGTDGQQETMVTESGADPAGEVMTLENEADSALPEEALAEETAPWPEPMALSNIEVTTFTELKNAIAAIPDDNPVTIEIAGNISFDTVIQTVKSKQIILKSKDGNQVTLTAENSRHFYVAPNTDVTFTFENVVLDGKQKGGGFHGSAQLTLIDPVITNCIAFPRNAEGKITERGGAIFLLGNRMVKIQGGEISGCEALYGGAIYANNLELEGTVIKGNRAVGAHGGGIYVFNGTFPVDINHAVIIENSAAGNGGGLVIANQSGQIKNTTVSGNAAGYGGGIALGNDMAGSYQITLSDSEITGNQAIDIRDGKPTGLGGGLLINSTVIATTIQNTTITQNEANLDGGGIFIRGQEYGPLVTEEVTFSENKASRNFQWDLNEQQENEMLRETSIVHGTNINDSFSFTAPFTHAYNNDDINFLPKHMVKFDAQGGNSIAALQRVDHGGLISAPASEPTREGYDFAGWYKTANGEEGSQWNFTADEVTADITLYAKWEKQAGSSSGGGGGGNKKPPLNVPDEEVPLGLMKDDHIAYMQGYPEGDFRPERSISRAEAAQLFYNLLINVEKTGYSSSFADVNAGAWYSDAVSCLAANHVIAGYPDGSFRPDSPITRAEFATLASKFDQLSLAESNRFADVQEGHWAVKYVNSAAVKGWIKGYENGEFRPERNITRAEVVTLVNAILERKVAREDILNDAKTFVDLNSGYWAYSEIMEATNGHNYSRKKDGLAETWHEIIH